VGKPAGRLVARQNDHRVRFATETLLFQAVGLNMVRSALTHAIFFPFVVNIPSIISALLASRETSSLSSSSSLIHPLASQGKIKDLNVKLLDHLSRPKKNPP